MHSDVCDYFIAALLVVPLVIHYRNTGRVLFFKASSEQLKLQDMHYELDKEIKNKDAQISPKPTENLTSQIFLSPSI